MTKLPHTHISRFTEIHRTALRKGFELNRNADGSWSLADAETGQSVPGASSTSFDNVVMFLRTQPLPG